MHQGCVRSRRCWREGSGGWWPSSPSCRWAGRSTTPASWPPTTNSTCLATVSPQAGGMAPAPTAWGWRAKPVAEFQAMFEGRHPATGELLGRPHGRNAVPAFDVVYGRPRASRSSTASVTQPLDGRCWPPTTPGWPRRPATWTSTWGPRPCCWTARPGGPPRPPHNPAPATLLAMGHRARKSVHPPAGSAAVLLTPPPPRRRRPAHLARGHAQVPPAARCIPAARPTGASPSRRVATTIPGGRPHGRQAPTAPPPHPS